MLCPRWKLLARILTTCRKLSKSKEKVPEADVQPKLEPHDAESSSILATIQESDSQSPDDSLNRKPVLQLVTNDSQPTWSFSYAGPISFTPHEDDESPTSPVGNDISPNIRALQYYPYSEHIRKSYYGMSKMQVGSVALEPLHSLPFDPSLRNAQLLHFCKSTSQPPRSFIDLNSSPKAGSFHVVDRR
jgi:hypothetical protein